MKVRIPIVTQIVKWLLAIFMFATASTALLGIGPEPEIAPGKLADFMDAIMATGYIFEWISGFKIVAAILLMIPKTSRFSAAITLGYSVNIFLYCVFIGTEYLPLGTFVMLANFYLIYAYQDWYKQIFNVGK